MSAQPASRYSIYDHMERKGMFRVNPANIDSRDNEGRSLYKGPVEFPKMLYSPLGEERKTRHESVETTPTGVITVPAQYELISAVAEDREAEALMLEAGWHATPEASIAAGNKLRAKQGLALRALPPKSPEAKVRDLSSENAALKAELDALRAAATKKGA